MMRKRQVDAKDSDDSAEGEGGRETTGCPGKTASDGVEAVNEAFGELTVYDLTDHRNL